MRSTSRHDLNAMGRRALDSQLKPLLAVERPVRPDRGWIRAIREAIGMTTGQFAKRLGVAQPRIAVLERAEADGGMTLKSLRQAAQALDCDFVYALVPRKPLEQMVQDRARQVAERQLARSGQSMRLENQAVSASVMARARDDLAAELMRNDRRLWAEE